MAGVGGVPKEVPQELREALERFQGQLKILLRNHQILVARSEKDPQDLSTLGQIGAVKRLLISVSNQQNVVLQKVRNFLSNLEEQKRRQNSQQKILGPPPPGPVTKAKPRKKEKRKSKDCTSSAKHSRSTSPDSSSEEAVQVYLAYLDPGPNCFRGHVEEYPVQEQEQQEHSEEEEDKEQEQEIVRKEEPSNLEEFMLNLALLTTKQCSQLEEQEKKRRRRKKKKFLSYVPEMADKKFKAQTFLQSCLTSPPHLRRRPPIPGSSAPAPPTLPRLPRATTFPLETRMGTRSKSPSVAKSQLDGVCDVEDFEMEDSEEEVLERLEVRNSLRKRRRLLLRELAELEARQEAIVEYRQVQKENKVLLLKQQEETEGKIQALLEMMAQLS